MRFPLVLKSLTLDDLITFYVYRILRS